MKLFYNYYLLLFVSLTFSQVKIDGIVKDEFGATISGANIYLKGTYDGAISDENGAFQFVTSMKGNQILVISYMSFETLNENIEIEKYKFKTFKLKENINTLDAVVVTAGTFQAGDNTKNTVLKPLDIVTTAGSVGNIIAALETLPGTQSVGEDGRLFVRGGEAFETQTYVDGIQVAKPYGISPKNIPTRSRFSPFLFKGMTFSTGGYSAEFGNALSSVLLMNTIDEPIQNQTEISLMSVGAGLGKTKKWDHSSFSINSSYINLAPYQWIVPQRVSWNKPVQSIATESVYRLKTKNGLLKVYGAIDFSSFDLNQKDINHVDPIGFDLNNKNLYFNSSYKTYLNEKWQLQAGLGVGFSKNKIFIDDTFLTNKDDNFHAKLKLRQNITTRINVNYGLETYFTEFDEKVTFITQEKFSSGYLNKVMAGFSEAEIFLSSRIAMNIGMRSSYSSYVDKWSIEPRASMAYKWKDNDQISLAYGGFTQTTNPDYMKFNEQLDYEKAQHFIANYMFKKEGKILRIEAYFKKYFQLIKYTGDEPLFNSTFSNDGEGYARGMDLFWRDNKTFHNFDYWFSYSWIDSKRDYKNYPQKVTPNFVANHNLSIVTKYFSKVLKSQIGITYSYHSGRPYNNPNLNAFMSEKTTAFHNLSLSCAYLISQQKILFFSMTNLLNRDNVFGYQYASNPNMNGNFDRNAINSPAKQFFFIGFFWTISDDKKANNLENL